MLRVVEERARAIGVELRHINVRHLDELDSVFATSNAQIETLTVIEDGLFLANRRRIADLATSHRLPSIGFRGYCEAGGLAGYGVDFPQIWRQAGGLVDQILKGANPGDLPVQQATRFEVVINLKAAKTLGITVPQAMLARADEVIE